MTPAMILVLLLGGTLIGVDMQLRGPSFWLSAWFLTKMAGVVFLFAWHGYLARSVRAFAQGRNQRSERFWRMTNELPFVAAILIVIAATTKFGA
jgi:putative membrane protein